MSEALENQLHTNGSLPPALVIHGGPIALSVARSLGRSGIRVFAIDQPDSYARYSRFCEWIPLRYGSEPQKIWLDWLTGPGLKKLRGAVILPCSDQMLEFIAKYRSVLKNDYLMFEADDDVLLSMLDKQKSYALAKKAGVPTPEIWSAHTREDILNVMEQVTYPCALKPRVSHEFIKHFPNKLLVIRDAREMMDTFNKVQALHLEMLVTEIIPGSDDAYCSYYSYLDQTGVPLFHFTKRKLRQYPNNFGLGTYHITDWNPEVAEMGLRFLKGVGYRGVGNVEFKRDPRDGQLKLIECNARLTLVTEMLTLSGINLPLFIYNRLTGRPLPPVNDYRKGLRVIRPLVDILAFRISHRRGEMSVWQWIRSILHRQHFLYFRWTDPMPSLVRIYPLLQKQMKLRVLARVIRQGLQKVGMVVGIIFSTVNKTLYEISDRYFS